MVAKFLQEFVKAAVAYQKKLKSSTSSSVPQLLPLKLDNEMEIKRDKIVRSFSIARSLYATTGRGIMHPIKESELEAGAEFLEVLDRSINCLFLFVNC